MVSLSLVSRGSPAWFGLIGSGLFRLKWLHGDDDDDVDDDVLTFAVFPVIVPVVAKQAVTKLHLDGRK